MTMQRKLVLCSMIILSASNAPALAAGVDIGVETEVPPPAARVEVIPPPGPGYLWAPGYWRWAGNRHDWVEGYWIKGTGSKAGRGITGCPSAGCREAGVSTSVSDTASARKTASADASDKGADEPGGNLGAGCGRRGPSIALPGSWRHGC